MTHKGKTASELEQLRLAKSEECQKIFDAHKVEQDGKTTYDLTPEQLDDVRARMAEINAIGKARDEVMETEQIAASSRAFRMNSRNPFARTLAAIRKAMRRSHHRRALGSSS